MGELENLRFQYNNLKLCLMKMEAHPDQFSDRREIRELQTLMHLALQTLEYRIKELDKIVYMQGTF